METRLKFIFEQIASVVRTVERISQAVQTDNFFFKPMTTFTEQIAQAIRMDDNFFWTGYPAPFKQIPNPFENGKP